MRRCPDGRVSRPAGRPRHATQATYRRPARRPGVFVCGQRQDRGVSQSIGGHNAQCIPRNWQHGAPGRMVSCLVVETDLGFCALATRGRGLWRCCLPTSSAREALDALALPCNETAAAGTQDLRATSDKVLQVAGPQLVAFLHGDPVDLAVELDLQDASPFTEAVLRECSLIPRGKTLSYGELAHRAGHPGAARAVGQTMARNLLPPFVPCHRVVGADGTLTGYGGGMSLKAKLLKIEGVALARKGCVLVLANVPRGRKGG